MLDDEPLLCPLALGNVLRRAEHAPGAPCFIPRHITLAVDDAHFAVRPHHAVFHVVARTAPQRSRHRLHHDLLIFGVDQFRQLGQV